MNFTLIVGHQMKIRGTIVTKMEKKGGTRDGN